MKRSSSFKNNRYCHPLVKQHAQGSHNKCNLSKAASLVGGEMLNGFFNVKNFDEEVEYQVCCNLADRLKAFAFPNKRKFSVNVEQAQRGRGEVNDAAVGAGSGETVEEVRQPTRASHRLNPSLMLKNNTFTKLKLIIEDLTDGGIDYNNNSDEGDDNNNSQEDENNTNESTKTTRRSKHDKLIDEVLEDSKQYYMGYNKLKEDQKKSRVTKMATKLLAGCINRKALKQDRMEYLRKNEKVAEDVVMLLDAVKDKLQSILLLNFDTEVSIDAENNREEDCNKEHTFCTAISLLSNTTKTSYNIVRKNIMHEFGIAKKDLPSYHMMTINRPKMVAFNVVPLELFQRNNTAILDINNTYNETTADAETIIPVETLSATSFIGNIDSNTIELSDAFDLLVANKNNDSLKACKIDGYYDDYVLMMAKN